MIRLLFFVLTCVFIFGCTAFISDKPSVEFVKGNVLLPQVTFHTYDSIPVYVEYWKEKGGTKERSKISAGRDHAIILMNLTQETLYNYIIRSEKNDKRTETHQFTTGKIPENVLTIEKEQIDTAVFNGYILLRRFNKSGADIIMNNAGEIVWYHLYDTIVRRTCYWTSQNTILSIYDTARIVETDLSGRRKLDIDLFKLGNPTFIHHDILFDKDNNIISLTADSVQIDARRFGGNASEFVYGDGLIRLSKEGKTLWRWSLLDSKNLHTLLKASRNPKEPIGHANSIAIAEDGNYLVSFRDFAQIWKIHSQTGEVLWKLGKGGDFKMDTTSYFIGQHSIHLNKRGNLVMFDNGKAKVRPNSRVLSLQINEINREAKAEFITTLPRSLSSYRMCSAYEIDVDKLLVCTSRQYAFVTVTNKAGEILWKIRSSNSSYRAYYIEDPFSGTENGNQLALAGVE